MIGHKSTVASSIKDFSNNILNLHKSNCKKNERMDHWGDIYQTLSIWTCNCKKYYGYKNLFFTQNLL